MKTSNIIITAFFTFIFSGVIILYVDASQHKKEMKEIMKEYELPPFSVVVAEEGSDLHINQSDSTKVSVEYINGQKAPSKIYEVVNDTLHIYGGMRTFVKCKNLNDLVVQKAFWVGVYKFRPDSLSIKANGGRLYLDNNGIKEKSFNIGIAANDSAYVEIINTNGNNISVESNNAEVRLYCKAKSVTAKLKHTAKLHVNNPENISSQRDTTSQLIMW